MLAPGCSADANLGFATLLPSRTGPIQTYHRVLSATSVAYKQHIRRKGNESSGCAKWLALVRLRSGLTFGQGSGLNVEFSPSGHFQDSTRNHHLRRARLIHLTAKPEAQRPAQKKVRSDGPTGLVRGIGGGAIVIWRPRKTLT